MGASRATHTGDGREPSGEGLWWWAVWESGSGAILDGVTALHAAGMTGFASPVVHVTVPTGNAAYGHTGVVLHRRRQMGPTAGAGIPRARLEVATIRAAEWAATERQAVLLVCLPVQQRLVHPQRLLDRWMATKRSCRRALLDKVVPDVCDGAHSLGELKFGILCRRYGLPAPSRQSQSPWEWWDLRGTGGS